jgi:hypothetical protein
MKAVGYIWDYGRKAENRGGHLLGEGRRLG